MKFKFKNFFIFILGNCVFGIGLAFSNLSLLGSNPMGVFVSGMCSVIPFSFAVNNLIASITEVAFGYIFDRDKVSIGTFISLVLGSFMIGLGEIIIPPVTSLTLRIIYMFIGLIVYCIGIAMMIEANVGVSSLDCYIFGLGKLLKVNEYHKIRWIVDISFLVIGIILKGVFNIGSILALLFSGILIEFFSKFIRKLI